MSQLNETAVILALSLPMAVLGCASRCPAGTETAGARPPTSTAQWCEAKQQTGERPRFPFRESTAHSGLRDTPVPPSPEGRPLSGPMTTWTTSGQLASHGVYILTTDGDSRPHGLWTFWHENGQVQRLGNYILGVPDGCFSSWEEDGTHHTWRWSEMEDRFERVACKGPTVASVGDLEDELSDVAEDTVQLDMSVGTFFSRGGLGIKTVDLVIREPGLSRNAELTLRKHFRRFRLGGLVALRSLDHGGYDAWVAAATVALALPSLHKRLSPHVSLALGAQRTEATLVLRQDTDFQSDSPLTVFGPYAALEVGAGFRAHRSVEFVLAARAEGGLPKEVTTTSVFRSGDLQPITRTAIWRVGRYSLGLILGLRVAVY